MKKIVISSLVLFTCVGAHSAYIPIFSVEVSPPQPSEGEEILLLADGEGSSTIVSYSTQVEIGADRVVLDMYVNAWGTTDAVRPWVLEQHIGPLASGNYTIIVNTYDNDVGQEELADTFETAFTVIPEPSSVLLLIVGSGGILFYRRAQRSGKSAVLSRRHFE